MAADMKPYAKLHENPKGAGDARPTAVQIVKDQGLVGKLTGKVMMVTGSTSGLGVETARALHVTGADVYITARTAAKAADVVEDIRSDGGPGKVEVIEMELDSMDSVKKGAQDFLSKSNKLNILVNNAGIMACPESTTKDGLEMQFGTNHIGHFLLFQLLKPTLLASATPDFDSRVISVSSSGHRGNTVHFEDFSLKKQEPDGYTPWGAYGQSKTANVYFANELNRRYGSKGLHANSLHPGGIMTPLQRHLDPAFMEQASKNEAIMKNMKSVEQGAATSVWAAIAKEWEGKGGTYLEDCRVSPPRDPNDNFPMAVGYAPHAYDEQSEKKLWKESLRIVGMEDDM